EHDLKDIAEVKVTISQNCGERANNNLEKGKFRDVSSQKCNMTASGRAKCAKCERPHSGECRSGSTACYRCKEHGHFMRDCPVSARSGESSSRKDQQRVEAKEKVLTMFEHSIEARLA
ncbi:hypothetical protein FCV25MIE_30521, partial [Fagus crenata]